MSDTAVDVTGRRAVAGEQAATRTWRRGPVNLADAVAAQLIHEIVTGERSPGEALPSGAALCAHFEVSLTVIREAMTMLAEKGLVRVRHGSGSIVCGRDEWNLLDPTILGASLTLGSDLDLVDDLVVTRRALEADMVYVAATARTDHDLGTLQTLVDRMDAITTEELTRETDNDFAVADLAFHNEIMKISGNRIARNVVHALAQQAHTSATYAGDRTAELARAANAGHRAILERMIDRDGPGARAAMLRHITEGWIQRRPASSTTDRLRRDP